MIKSHEQQLELRLPRIGVIRKGAAKPEKGPGKDLDYFRLTRADAAVEAAWREVFGPEPKAISGILPYADPAANLEIWDELWQGKRMLWRGDGERLHIQLQGNAYVRYAPGEGPAQPAAAGEMVNKLKVARISRLRLLLPQLRIAGIFEIDSSSAIDADELWSNLMWIRSTVPTLQGAPVTVFRSARQFNVPQADGKTMAVTKHMLHMMLDGRYLEALLPGPGGPQLAAPVAAPALPAGELDADAPDEGEYEDEAVTMAAVSEDLYGGGYGASGTVRQATPAGPPPDDEVVIGEATAAEFVTAAAALLETDTETLKGRMKALGYTGVPGKPEERVKAYRRLKGDLGENVQEALFGEMEPEPVKFVDPA